MVSIDELKGKKVVGANALILGEVEGAEVNVQTWQITHLHVGLTKESTEQLAFKKPTLGHLAVFLPVSNVKAVGDVVSLDKSIIELKSLLEVKK
jgi:sporulation protein YlmC with PRC-barrel domain